MRKIIFFSELLEKNLKISEKFQQNFGGPKQFLESADFTTRQLRRPLLSLRVFTHPMCVTFRMGTLFKSANANELMMLLLRSAIANQCI